MEAKIDQLEQLLSSVEASIKEVERWTACRDQCEDYTDGYANGIEDAISEFENIVDEIKAMIRSEFYERMANSKTTPQPGQLLLFYDVTGYESENTNE